jgi:hypothetical protein
MLNIWIKSRLVNPKKNKIKKNKVSISCTNYIFDGQESTDTGRVIGDEYIKIHLNL